MAEQESLWYRIGYGLEQARGAAPRAARLRSLAERRPDKVARPRPPRPAAGEEAPKGDGYEALLGALATALGARALDLVPARRRPGLGRLLKAGAAGAGAAVLRELLRPMIASRGDGRTLQEAVAEAAVAGTARGLLYGAIVEPRLPGPAPVQGTLYGLLEYLASPWGGLAALVGRKAPHRKIPVLRSLFDDLGPEADTLADHLAFAVTLAVLYGSDVREVRHGGDAEA